jgi:hypothetical protein
MENKRKQNLSSPSSFLIWCFLCPFWLGHMLASRKLATTGRHSANSYTSLNIYSPFKIVLDIMKLRQHWCNKNGLTESWKWSSNSSQVRKQVARWHQPTKQSTDDMPLIIRLRIDALLFPLHGWEHCGATTTEANPNSKLITRYVLNWRKIYE